jgi:hypothetical protein
MKAMKIGYAFLALTKIKTIFIGALPAELREAAPG